VVPAKPFWARLVELAGLTANPTAKRFGPSALSPLVVLDGGGLVTLSGQGVRRILYMDTCDQAQVWTTSHRQDQPSPRLVIQSLAFTDGNSSGELFDGGGGGSGGAIYNDGDQMTLTIAGSVFTGNRANEGGGAVFFVSDDRSGAMTITDSTLEHNPNAGFHTAGLPGIFYLGAHAPVITASVLSDSEAQYG
jgi:hypothetical protein